MTTMTAFEVTLAHVNAPRFRFRYRYCYRCCYFLGSPHSSTTTPMSPSPITPTPSSSTAAAKLSSPNPSSGTHARLLCCDPNLAKEGNCTLDEVIIQKNHDHPNFPKRIKTFFQGTDDIVQMETQMLEINATGMYYLYFMFYNPLLKGTTIEGRTVRLVSEYSNFNSTGARPIGITLWAVTFTSVKKMLSWLLLLVVSMGYRVVHPTLGGHGVAYRVLLLCLLYFVAFKALELFEHLGNIHDFSGKPKLLLVLPVVSLEHQSHVR
ncbi:hypothetical protein Fmac_031549 [Flemingia macrophylla]|uniref:GOST seven transmembrane domain-containing protein n=1 Tax=Flemingia macrophylla TaxID=520843 RepID=A0ABD1L2T2_9FABA